MKAMIAMSGGVDSSVAAYLMQQSGYECAGGMMMLCSADLLGCAPADSVSDARAVASRLDLPFYCFDNTGNKAYNENFRLCLKACGINSFKAVLFEKNLLL